jgi:uncharacterized membrane protein (UPF0127 family)
MKKILSYTIIILLLLGLVASCVYFIVKNFQSSPMFSDTKSNLGTIINSNKEFLKVDDLAYKGKEIQFKKLEIAKSEAELQKGMMNRLDADVCERCGMLFVFEDVQPRSFWMKDTLIPLEITFLESDGKVINKHTAKENQTSELYNSNKPAKYVLEYKPNSTLAGEIKIGDVININKLVESGVLFNNSF